MSTSAFDIDTGFAMPVPKFRDSRERAIWVKRELELNHQSLTTIAVAAGISRQAVTQALFRPSARAEELIASALGVTTAHLFPERFSPDGRRLHRSRHDSELDCVRNVDNREAA
jgi:lambda repressor-like predicted transcriptional regulator